MSDFEDFGVVTHLREVVGGLLGLLSLLPIPLVNLVAIESQFLGDFFSELLVPSWVLLKVFLENIDLLFGHKMIRVEDWLVITPFRFVNYLINIISDIS